MHRFLPSLLDRLIDADPASPAEPLRPSYSLDELEESVARDVESLLNARRGAGRQAIAGLAQGRRSTLAYGLEDFSAMSLASGADRAAICRAIERALADHEPRLRDARVEPGAHGAGQRGAVFTIAATLAVHPLREPLSLEATLQSATRTYAVRRGGRPA